LGQEVYRTGNGIGYNWQWDYSAQHFGYFVGGEGYSTNYRADVGFTQRTNNNSNIFFYRYASEPKPKAKLISWRYNQFSRIDYDWQGHSQNWRTGPQMNFQFQRQTWVGIGFNASYERIFEGEFGAKRTATRPGAFYGNDPERSANSKGFFSFVETEPL